MASFHALGYEADSMADEICHTQLYGAGGRDQERGGALRVPSLAEVIQTDEPRAPWAVLPDAGKPLR